MGNVGEWKLKPFSESLRDLQSSQCFLGSIYCSRWPKWLGCQPWHFCWWPACGMVKLPPLVCFIPNPQSPIFLCLCFVSAFVFLFFVFCVFAFFLIYVLLVYPIFFVFFCLKKYLGISTLCFSLTMTPPTILSFQSMVILPFGFWG